MFSIHKNDEVQIIAGREKGKTGKVVKVDTKTGRVTIAKVNMVKRHIKPSQKHPQGGILEKEQSIHYSNVQLFCSKCSRGVRHGHKMITGAKKAQTKVRVCKRCDQQIDAA